MRIPTFETCAYLSIIITFSTILTFCAPGGAAQEKSAAQDKIQEIAARERDSLEKLYIELHKNPELSYGEERTAARIALELKNAGFEVTAGFGKYTDPKRVCHGVVGILKNGDGPTILVRTDLDALPVPEKTGLDYASKVKTKNEAGEEVPVMHACGHDMHMTAFVGAARALAATKGEWKGTLVFVGQPAEETAPGGAEAMLRAGLYEQFTKPKAAFALHCNSSIKAGQVGYVRGFALANADSVDITIRGQGGHGSYPQGCKDPIVLASQMILAFQTIISREVPPGDPSVITVGSIHGGTKHNIIPDEVKLQLTVRSYSSRTRDILLKGIDRVAKGTAQAAGFPKELEPIVHLNPDRLVPATYNNPTLVNATIPVLQKTFGESNVIEMDPVLGAEDFGHYSLPDHSIPCVIFWLGTLTDARIKELASQNRPLPSMHSSQYYPAIHPTIETGVRALCAAVISQMK